MLRSSKVLLPVVATATVLGLIGLWDRVASGERNLTFGSYIPWGLWLGLYVYLVGVSAGAFIVAALHYVFRVSVLERPARLALPIALVTLGSGLFLVLLDLGHIERFWELFTRTSFSSILGSMVWAYSIYGLVLIAMLVAVARGRVATARWLALAGIGIVITFAGGEGALFGVVGARSTWNSGLQPIRFLLTAMAGGLAVVSLAMVLFRRWPADAGDAGARRWLGRTLLTLVAVYALVEFAELSVAMYTRIPAVVDAHWLALAGPYWWVFWIVQLAIGVVIPVALLAAPGEVGPTRLGVAAAAAALGLAGAKQNIILPGLAVPELRGLPDAFVDPRLSVTYFPGLTEWLVAIGVVGAAALAFILAVELLPFLRSPAGPERRITT